MTPSEEHLLRFENARLRRQLEEASAATARLRTLLAEARGEAFEKPANTRERRQMRSWLIDWLAKRGGSVTVDDIVRETGRPREHVYTAAWNSRGLLISEGAQRKRRYSLRADALKDAG